MKKIGILSILVLSMSIISCSNDDDNLSQNKLIGKWTLKSKQREYSKGNVEYATLSECEKKFTYDFVNDKKLIATEYKGENCETPKSAEGDYNFDSNTNILLWPNGRKYLVSFESNLLKLQTNYESPSDFDGDGNNDKFFIVLEK